MSYIIKHLDYTSDDPVAIFASPGVLSYLRGELRKVYEELLPKPSYFKRFVSARHEDIDPELALFDIIAQAYPRLEFDDKGKPMNNRHQGCIYAITAFTRDYQARLKNDRESITHEDVLITQVCDLLNQMSAVENTIYRLENAIQDCLANNQDPTSTFEVTSFKGPLDLIADGLHRQFKLPLLSEQYEVGKRLAYRYQESLTPTLREEVGNLMSSLSRFFWGKRPSSPQMRQEEKKSAHDSEMKSRTVERKESSNLGPRGPK